jgi:hypothetical protein
MISLYSFRAGKTRLSPVTNLVFEQTQNTLCEQTKQTHTIITTLSNISIHQEQEHFPRIMAYQPIVCCLPGQMNTFNRNRTSILRKNELVEIQGSYWPRISILSERKVSMRKSKKTPTKVPRTIKKKMELIKHLKPIHTPPQSPISPSYEASPACFDQNTSPCWMPSVEDANIAKAKTSSMTGRPVFPRLDAHTKPTGQSSSGLMGPRRRKPLKMGVALR